MKNIFITFHLILGILFGPQILAQSSNTYALIIGVAKYQHPNIKHLKYADKDALAFKGMLMSKSGGLVKHENIKCFINDSATSTNILASMRWVENVPKSGDRMIIYFSGHGDAIDPEQVYLLTYDANASDPNLYDNSAISMYKLKNLVKRLRLKGVEVVLITDACRTNEEADNSTAGIYSFESIMNKDNGEIKMNSCSQNQKSMEDPRWGNGHGVFTYYLLQGWMGMANENDDNEITVGELFRYVSKHVKDATYDIVRKKTLQVPSSCCSQHEDVVISTLDSETLKRLKDVEDQIVVPDDVFAYATSKSGNDGYDEDTATMRIYNNLVGAIASDKILQPAGYSAFDYYLELKKAAKDKPIFYDGESELLAILNAKGQQLVSDYLNGSVENINYNVFKNAYDYMMVGLKIMSKEDIYYSNFKCKSLFLESQYLMFRNSTRDLALLKIDSAIAIQPKGAYLFYSKGLIYEKYLNYDSAIVYYNKAIELAPKWYAPYSQKSEILIKLGQLTSATSCMNGLIIKSSRANDYNALGMFYYEMDSLETAVKYYKLALDKDPNLMNPSIYLYECYRLLMKDSLSKMYYKQALNIDPNNLIFKKMEASYLEEIGDDINANTIYNELYELDTTNLYYFVKAAKTLYKYGEEKKAIADLKWALGIDPYFINTYFVIIDLLEERNEWESSIEYNKYLMSFYPGYNPAILYNTYMRQGNMDSAEYYLHLGELKFPNDKFVASTRGYDLMHKGKFNEAIPVFEKLITNGTWDTDNYMYLAYCYFNIQNQEKALFYSKKALDTDKQDWRNYKNFVFYLFQYKYSSDTITYYTCYPYNSFNLISEEYLDFACYNLCYTNSTDRLGEFANLGIDLYPNAYYFHLYQSIYYLKKGDKKKFYNSFQNAVKLGMYCGGVFEELQFMLPDTRTDKKYLQMSKNICKD